MHEEQHQSPHLSSGKHRVTTFDQQKGDGRLSPLRSSSKWDDVHNAAIQGYGMRASASKLDEMSQNERSSTIQYKSRSDSRTFDGRRSSHGQQQLKTFGHKKCYYEEMSSVVRSRLAGLMIMVAEEEMAIERQRQSLAKLVQFEPYAAFSRIDRENLGYICGKEIKEFLIENGYFHLLEAETNYIVKYFDSCPNEHPYNRLDYQDFMSIILPCSDVYLRADVTQRPSQRTLRFENLNPMVEKELAILLAKEIDFELRLEQLKQDLEKFKLFSIRRAFKAIDYQNNKIIDEASIRRFLKRVGHQPVKPELTAIMRRFDLDGDAKLSFTEFAEALNPIQPDIIQNPTRFTVSQNPTRQANTALTTIQDNARDEDILSEEHLSEGFVENDMKRSIEQHVLKRGLDENRQETLEISANEWNRYQDAGARDAQSPAPGSRVLLPKYHQTRLVKSVEKTGKGKKKRRSGASHMRKSAGPVQVETPDRSVTFASKMQASNSVARASKRRGKSAENWNRERKGMASTFTSSYGQTTAASSQLLRGSKKTNHRHVLTFGDMQSSHLSQPQPVQTIEEANWMEVQSRAKSPNAPDYMRASQVAQEENRRSQNGLNSSSFSSNTMEMSGYGRRQSPLRDSNIINSSSSTYQGPRAQNLRTKFDQENLRDKEIGERRTLQSIDEVEEMQGPPKSRQAASKDLGRRSHDKKRTSHTRKTTEQKIQEEMARLFLDQVYLEKEVEKLKCELAHRIDYTCMAAFHVFNFRGIEAFSKAEFTESLFSYIGNSFYNRDQAHLLFSRYDQDMDGRINYREWCRIIIPQDRVLSGLLLGRTPSTDRMTMDTQEVFKRLLRAHLNLEQAHEYLRQRIARTRGANVWSLREIYDCLDSDHKGTITVYDLEKLVMSQKKGGSRSIVEDIELLIAMYDREGFGKISYVDFQNELIPRLE